MWNEKFVWVLNYLKIFKAVHKSNARTHLPQQNKKAVLTTVAYFIYLLPYGRRDSKRRCFWYKPEIVKTYSEFWIFELI